MFQLLSELFDPLSLLCLWTPLGESSPVNLNFSPPAAFQSTDEIISVVVMRRLKCVIIIIIIFIIIIINCRNDVRVLSLSVDKTIGEAS